MLEFIPMFSMDSPTFAEDLANAMGIKPGDKIEIKTPQFERIDGVQVKIPEFSPEDWANLYRRDHSDLMVMGLGVWNKNDQGTHYLLPKDWYGIIPNGLALKCIDGTVAPFEAGVTDDDYRYGCLAYGFFKPNTEVVTPT